tara:strand:+ start:99 stop:431 length:333 start_codon:yes stop_codon:yes gene_type:complete
MSVLKKIDAESKPIIKDWKVWKLQTNYTKNKVCHLVLNNSFNIAKAGGFGYDKEESILNTFFRDVLDLDTVNYFLELGCSDLDKFAKANGLKIEVHALTKGNLIIITKLK